jgi:hypothetical protein
MCMRNPGSKVRSHHIKMVKLKGLNVDAGTVEAPIAGMQGGRLTRLQPPLSQD